MDNKPKSFISIADKACRDRYIELLKEVFHKGLITAEIKKNYSEFLISDGKYNWVTVEAYKPTGVALGHPLPDPETEKLLWRICHLSERWLNSRLGRSDSFAFVPKECYHVTLNNYSHFDKNKKIVKMPDCFIKPIKELIMDNRDPISINFRGLILTQKGRLIVPGYPVDEKLYHLRRELVAKIPKLAVNLPKIAHIKLGHLLHPLDHETVLMFQKWLTRRCRKIDRTIEFSIIHTPLCDIPLKETVL